MLGNHYVPGWRSVEQVVLTTTNDWINYTANLEECTEINNNNNCNLIKASWIA